MSRSIDEAISEVEREAHVRMKCFDKWVSEGRLSWVDAYDRMERILSAVKHLRDMQTNLKLEELRNTTVGVNTDHTAVEEWAQQARSQVTNTVPFKPEPANTAPQSPAEEYRREVGA